MNVMNDAIISRLRHHAQTLYNLGDDMTTTRAWLDQAQIMRGFIDALKVCGVMEKTKIFEIIDETHQEIFGESRSERRERQRFYAQNVGETRWDAFDEPAFLRISPSVKNVKNEP